jgi:hypothetical protein
MTVTLFTFDRADEAAWYVVNDGVMGGRSAGGVVVEGGMLRFTGTLVTQGGGFTSVRARRDVDLSGEDGLELRVRGSGRPFEVELDDGQRRFGPRLLQTGSDNDLFDDTIGVRLSSVNPGHRGGGNGGN